MFRLTFYLLAGIGLAMYFAPDAPPAAPQAKAEPAKVPPASPTDDTMATPVSFSTPPAPKVSRKRPPVTRTSAYQMVSFLEPVIIGPDGEIQSEPEQIAPVEPAKAAAVTQADIPVLYVTGNRVNVRGGPSTSDPVLGSVEFAEAVQVLTDPTEPWVLIRIEGDGVEGYMSSKFLTESDPQG